MVKNYIHENLKHRVIKIDQKNKKVFKLSDSYNTQQ